MNQQKLTDYGALLLRVALGTMFVAHGLLKVLVFTMPGTAAFFAQVGFPGWMAYPVVYAEIGGGILLILGIQARFVALALVPVLAGAALVHVPNGWLFTAPNGGWEYPVFLTVAALVQGLIGNGAYALQVPFAARRPAVA